MKTVTLKFINAPKPGKSAWTAKDTDDVFYLIDKKIDAQSLPKDIPIEVECGEWNDLAVLKSWKAAPQEVVAKAQIEKSRNNDISGMTRIVADAIRAGLIKEPSEMTVWALAYREVVEVYNSEPTMKVAVKGSLPDTPPEYPEPTGELSEIRF